MRPGPSLAVPARHFAAMVGVAAAFGARFSGVGQTPPLALSRQAVMRERTDDVAIVSVGTAGLPRRASAESDQSCGT